MSTSTRYFELWDHRSTEDRWHLSSPVDENGEEIDPWQFKAGTRLELKSPPIFQVTHPGRELEFTLTAFTIPLVHERVASVLEPLGLQQEVQLIPARVQGRKDPFFILNVLQVLRCIDDARCEEARRWTPEDGKPARVGTYRDVRGLKIDPSKVEGAHLFRPWGWKVVLIVSEPIKLALEAASVTGTRFTEV